MSSYRGGRGGFGSSRGGDEHNGFKNPKFSQGVKPVSSETEKMIKQKLDEFSQGSAPSLNFPPMGRAERKRVHELAGRYGLNSSSKGAEPNRTCVVTRRRMPNMMSSVAAQDTDPIKLTKEMKQVIRELVRAKPIGVMDIDDHLSVAPQKSRSRTSRDNIQPVQLQRLVPPHPSCSAPMLHQRKQLPAFDHRQELLEAMSSHQVVLITGGTGCGKTTQVPQFLLEEAAQNHNPLRIICTQPRRLPAIAVAERVAKERNERIGSTVGYHIRLEQKTSPATVLTYCTSGVLLRMLTTDDEAIGVSHIILDEIHEREQNTDYLLIALKQALKKRQDLKVILMSATMEGNLKMFTEYFGDNVRVKHIDIPSRLYNVDKFFLGEVLALTGYSPPEDVYGGFISCSSTDAFTGIGFPSVSHWNSTPQGLGGASNQPFETEKRDWDDDWSKPPPGRQDVVGAGLTEVQTAPNLQSLHASHSQSNLNSGRTGPPVSQQSLINNMAQQLANSQSSFSLSSQQQQLSGNQYSSQFGQSQQSYFQPSGSGFMQPQNSFAQSNQSMFALGTGLNQQQQYSQPPPSMPHATSWVAGMEHPNGTTPQPDVVDLPLEMDEASLENMRQMGFGVSNFDGAMDHGQSSAASWLHTQSYPVIAQLPQGQQQPLHSWETQSGQIYQSQQTNQTYSSSLDQNQQPVFYVQSQQDDTSGTNRMNYFNNPMNGTVGYPVNPPPATQPSTCMSNLNNIQSREDNTYEALLRREKQQTEFMRAQLRTALPHRPHSFVPNVQGLLERMPVDPAALVNMYMKMGGQQWSDAVDLQLITTVVKYCMNSSIEGAILVFLPGYDDICQMRDKIMEVNWHGGLEPEIYTLHSQMNSMDQQRVFDLVGHGKRKVILSTNIAEASLTIDDVVFVIDSGKVKEKTYNHTSRISQLKVAWIAKSNAEQRSGRAGRCRPGFCFRLYSRDDYNTMLVTQMAEMQRSAIHDVCLHAKMFAPENMTVKQFLALAPEPPSAEAIENSMNFLEQLGAIYSEASTSDMDTSISSFNRLSSAYQPPEPQLTDLGRMIAHLPLDPQLARLLIFGVSMKCLSPVVTLVAALSHRDPFILPNSDERERANRARDQFGQRDYSDHIALLRAVNEFESKGHQEAKMFCRANFLAANAMKMIQGIRRQLLIELRRVRMIAYDGDPLNVLRDVHYNKFSDCWPMVQAAIVAGCYPCIGFVKSGSNKMRKIRTSTEASATLHPSSLIKRQIMASSKKNDVFSRAAEANGIEVNIEYLAFQELAKLDEGLTLRTVTAVPPVAVVLCGGAIRLKKSVIEDTNIVMEEEEDDPSDDASSHMEGFTTYYVLELEEWLAVRGSFPDMQRLMQLRFKFMQYMISVMSNPRQLTQPGVESRENEQLLEAVSKVLVMDHTRRGFNPVQKLMPQSWRYTSTSYNHNQQQYLPLSSEQRSRQIVTGSGPQSTVTTPATITPALSTLALSTGTSKPTASTTVSQSQTQQSPSSSRLVPATATVAPASKPSSTAFAEKEKAVPEKQSTSANVRSPRKPVESDRFAMAAFEKLRVPEARSPATAAASTASSSKKNGMESTGSGGAGGSRRDLQEAVRPSSDVRQSGAPAQIKASMQSSQRNGSSMSSSARRGGETSGRGRANQPAVREDRDRDRERDYAPTSKSQQSSRDQVERENRGDSDRSRGGYGKDSFAGFGKGKGRGFSGFGERESRGLIGLNDSYDSQQRDSGRDRDGDYQDEYRQRKDAYESFGRDERKRCDYDDYEEEEYGHTSRRRHDDDYQAPQASHYGSKRRGRFDSYGEGGGGMYADREAPSRRHNNKVSAQSAGYYDDEGRELDDEVSMHDSSRGGQMPHQDEMTWQQHERFSNEDVRDRDVQEQRGAQYTRGDGLRGKSRGKQSTGGYYENRRYDNNYRRGGNQHSSGRYRDYEHEEVPEDPVVENENWNDGVRHPSYDYQDHQYIPARETSSYGGGGKGGRGGKGYAKNRPNFNKSNYDGDQQRGTDRDSRDRDRHPSDGGRGGDYNGDSRQFDNSDRSDFRSVGSQRDRDNRPGYSGTRARSVKTYYNKGHSNRS